MQQSTEALKVTKDRKFEIEGTIIRFVRISFVLTFNPLIHVQDHEVSQKYQEPGLDSGGDYAAFHEVHAQDP